MLIAIVDDIAEERILLRTRLENILDQKNVEFHCYEYENGEAFLKASKEHDFTVLFLDISKFTGDFDSICPVHINVQK